jgi:hypothetical protein
MLTAWIVSLAVLAVAVIAFLIIKAPQKPISSDQDSHPNIAAVAPIKPLQEDQAKVQENAQSETVTSQTQRAEGPASQPKSAPSDANKIVPEKDAASKLDQAETARKSAYPVSGTIIWTGNLGKNSVLVISAQKASIGSVTGELPGRPVSISVDPSDLVIRQMPDQVNEWKQIMLYSGSKKYTSITIRWKTTR